MSEKEKPDPEDGETDEQARRVREGIDKAGKLAGSFADWAKGKARKAAEIAGKAKDDFDKSELKKRVEKKAGEAVQAMDEAGISGKMHSLAGAAGDQLDTVTGKKSLQIVEQRLELQARYNDVLAAKLQEALERIERLEAELARVNKGKPE